MAFKPVAKKPKVADNPVDFFQDLRPRKIAALYDQQAQIMRDYSSRGIEETDVAIQGATGSGKTLVGLVLAEWRRRKFQERSVYICPTRQLVHQVANFARDQLGLPAYAFVGRKSEFPPSERSGWRSGDVLAITTYSAIFNTNPFFAAPNFIVVDDAHAAEQYISEFWTLRISRLDSGQRPLFEAIASVLERTLPADEHARITQDPRGLSDHLWVQMVPATGFYEVESEISAILDEAPEHSDLYFRWQTLKGHLRACQVYVSPYEILIRPIVPPTKVHTPFNNANQRLYMSATLGRGGELERLSGRKNIVRLPSPSGWDGHGVGRRFFIFPNASLSEDESSEFVEQLIEQTDPSRALILTPDDRTGRKIEEGIEEHLEDFEVFDAQEIEKSKEPFISSEKAVAIIANRFDGIDFPDDECRLLVIGDKPAGANLQERYLAEKLGARALFSERTRTRLIQAFGRCTRSAKDYAIVCVMGHKLMDELLLSEYRSALDNELQAEIKFGEAQSINVDGQALLENAKLFLEQGEDWRGAEDQLSVLRDEAEQVRPEALSELEKASKHEIDYVEAMWVGQFDTALDAAQKAISALSGGDALKGYRAMWQYLAGCAAHLLAAERSETSEVAAKHFSTARSIGGIRVANTGTAANDDTQTLSALDQEAIQKLEANLVELGLTNQQNFARLEKSIREGLASDDSKKFEAAQEKLGDLLGFVAQNTEAKGDPDPQWYVGQELCFVFEDHVKETAGTEISLEKARQVAGHPNWVRANITALGSDAEIVAVLVTNASTDAEECQIHLGNVAIWDLADFRSWANEVLAKIRLLRSRLKSAGDLAWRAEAAAALADIHATPTALLTMLIDRRP